jgi:vacuolar-type H+-ATPase subunit H
VDESDARVQDPVRRPHPRLTINNAYTVFLTLSDPLRYEDPTGEGAKWNGAKRVGLGCLAACSAIGVVPGAGGKAAPLIKVGSSLAADESSLKKREQEVQDEIQQAANERFDPKSEGYLKDLHDQGEAVDELSAERTQLIDMGKQLTIDQHTGVISLSSVDVRQIAGVAGITAAGVTAGAVLLQTLEDGGLAILAG